MTKRETRLLPGLAAAIACVLSLSACRVDQKGMVLLIDPSYRAVMVGSSNDGFSMPDGILWRNGKLLLADEGGHAVRVWGSAHDVKNLCDTSLGIREPEDLVMDAEGNLFFTDDTAGGLWEVDRAGKASLLAGKDKGLVSTEGIALAPSGDLLVGDGLRHCVYRVTRSGNVSVFLGVDYHITKPESMAFDDSGNLYIADNQDQVLYLLTPDMKLERVIDNHGKFYPETIWYADHTLYINDSMHGKLSRYTPEEGLRTIALFAGKLRNISGITTDDKGSVYVSIQNLREAIGYVVKLEREPHPGTGSHI
jgi:sugar lactone lactonase YvrE